jgi:DNA-binding XRE family transcriptional regulator
MNQIEHIRDSLLSRFDGIVATIGAPADRERGAWFLDIERREASPLVVEWRPDRGFGITSLENDDPAFGAGPDEVYPNAREALQRVQQLILTGARTEPPAAVRLAELRQRRGLTQAELAERAGVGQANVSQIERRGDVLVSTLAKVIAAMGASLSICARFPDGTEQVLEFESVTPGTPDLSRPTK